MSVAAVAPRARRARALLLPGVVALVVPFVLVGCATVATPSVRGGSAARLLGELVLPAGAGPLASAGGVPTSFQSDDSGCGVEREQYWRVPGLSIAAAQAWFEQHVPKGLRQAGTGSGGNSAGETMTEVDYTVRTGEQFSSGSRLVVEAVTDGYGSAVRASAQIVPAAGCGTHSKYSGLPSYRAG